MAHSTIRIIAGQWRGRRLPVLDRPGLRPTGDRMRETLFNWLMPELPGARCLDLFAGTGALGLEAASRGAEEVVLVERDPACAEHLRKVCAELPGNPSMQVVSADALAWLASSPRPRFHLVFIDPPFANDAWQSVCDALPPWLARPAWVYLETPADGEPPKLSADWSLHRQLRTRQAMGRLFSVN